MFCFPLYEYHYSTLSNYYGNYLEIGVYNGDAIANLAKAYPEKYIIGIDPFIEDGCTINISGVTKGSRLLSPREETYKNINGFKNIFFYEMTSGYFYLNLTEKHITDANVSVVMIDGDHSYEGAKTDVDLALKLIGNNRGEISFDDTEIEGVSQAMQYLENIANNRIVNKIKVDSKWDCYVYILSQIEL